jgi:hypothetical protein
MTHRTISFVLLLFTMCFASACGRPPTQVYVNMVTHESSDARDEGQDEDRAPTEYTIFLVISMPNGLKSDFYWSSRYAETVGLVRPWNEFLNELADQFEQQCGVELAYRPDSPAKFMDLIETTLMPPKDPPYHRTTGGIGSYNSYQRTAGGSQGTNSGFSRQFQVYKSRR